MENQNKTGGPKRLVERFVLVLCGEGSRISRRNTNRQTEGEREKKVGILVLRTLMKRFFMQHWRKRVMDGRMLTRCILGGKAVSDLQTLRSNIQYKNERLMNVVVDF